MGVASAEPLWRAIAVYRFASIGYAVLLVVINRADYSRPGWAWVVIAVMTAWTAATTVAYARPERRERRTRAERLGRGGSPPGAPGRPDRSRDRFGASPARSAKEGSGG